MHDASPFSHAFWFARVCRFVEFSADELLKGFGQSAIYNATNPFSWMESKAAAAPKALAPTSSASPKTVEVCPPNGHRRPGIQPFDVSLNKLGCCVAVFLIPSGFASVSRQSPVRATRSHPSCLISISCKSWCLTAWCVRVQATTDTTKLSFGLDDDDF